MSKINEILQRAAAGAYGEDSDAIGKMAGIVRASTFDRGSGPFICGDLGHENGGLHDGYLVCAAYGSDCTDVYIRKSRRDCG